MKIVRKSMMLVRPETRPEETEYFVNGFKLYKPAAGVGIEKGLDVERRQGEWWPHKAEVVACSDVIVHGFHEDGGEAYNEDTGQYIQTISPTMHRSWRLPQAGDTAHFGFKDLHPGLLQEDGCTWIDITKARCVIPADGSDIWAIGPYGMVELLPDVDDGLLIKSTRIANKLGMGVVRMVGDGFAEAQPDAKVGSVVSFIVYSMQNPVFPNPVEGGPDLCPILGHMIIGIDESGILAEELDELKALAAKRLKDVSDALSAGNVLVEQEKARLDRLREEQEEESWNHARKMRDKHYSPRIDHSL